MSDGIGTQVRTQMINKCKIKMAQNELYNVRDPSWGGDQKNRKEHYSKLSYNCTQLWLIDRKETSSDTSESLTCVWLSSNSILAVVRLI